MAEHIHRPLDGRGMRKIFVNGNQVDRVFYADTKKGIVDYYPQPIRVHKHGKRMLSRRLRGHVEVVNDG